MKSRKHTVEQIISKLREAEVALAKGQLVAQVARKLGITEQTYHWCWSMNTRASVWRSTWPGG